MKTFTLSLFACLMLCACGNKATTQEQDSKTAQEQDNISTISIDELLSSADSLTDKQITIEGVCTHTCRHGARKIFLQGSDNAQIIRCEYEDHRPFSKDCIHSVVRVTGYLRETRMDEAYLANWKMEYELAKAQGQIEDEETNTSAGCATESAARRESGNTVDDKIAHYRQLIAQRKEAEGKEYLSFYHIEATDYKVLSE